MNKLYKQDTIAASATASGLGVIGIIHISGKNLLPMAQSLSGGKKPHPRYALHSNFLAADGSVIDDGLMLFFPAPNSFTGEDVIELHGHAGKVVSKMLLERCIELGARLAEPGEFSKRAFLNDKIDLAQAESIADLISANSIAAVRSAHRSLSGEFSQRIHQLVEKIINLRMLVEATLDFPEEDLDFLKAGNAHSKLIEIQQSLAVILDNAKQGAILREGMRVVLVGAPNVGKSSLLNALAGDEIAIVTDIAGTTRDTLREEIIIDGIVLHIIDTAGLRESDDKVEKLGIQRTLNAVQNADIALILLDKNQDALPPNMLGENLPKQLPRLMVVNKIDLSGEAPSIKNIDGQVYVHLSAKTGDGIKLLKQKLLEQIGWHGSEEGVFLARERHLSALRAAEKYLQEANIDYKDSELIAESLRLAQHELGKITGEFAADDLLGEIFSRFCIGK